VQRVSSTRPLRRSAQGAVLVAVLALGLAGCKVEKFEDLDRAPKPETGNVVDCTGMSLKARAELELAGKRCDPNTVGR
jgi:hypothetical protein